MVRSLLTCSPVLIEVGAGGSEATRWISTAAGAQGAPDGQDGAWG